MQTEGITHGLPIAQARSYWYSRFLLERALALIYLVAFIVAANQFVPLLGEHGLLPVSQFVQAVPFRASPSLFFFAPTDLAFRTAAWLGIALACLALSSFPSRYGAAAGGAVCTGLWVLYLSFVNVGQIFYGFGWETLLLEASFLAILAGKSSTEPNRLLIWMWRWLTFRVMFGAGLIKLRGDSCWRDLTCLDYYFETQPIPNPLSWHFHWLPAAVHHAGVLLNHFVELIVPFALFIPQPGAAIAGFLIIAFQLVLIVSGNLSWLNWLTLALAISALDDRWLSWIPITRPALQPDTRGHRIAVYALGVAVAVLSLGPVLNMLSQAQVMNTPFEPLHLVNTYGAFGRITRERREIVVEGTDDAELTDRTVWREYEFRGKPGDAFRRAPQLAPYHLRLDWLMWFAAMDSPENHPWFTAFIVKLLEGNPSTLSLLRVNPFPDHPPRVIRAELFSYRFTTPDERRRTGQWWIREPIGYYFPPVSRRQSPNARP
jgi:hypothetical protein